MLKPEGATSAADHRLSDEVETLYFNQLVHREITQLTIHYFKDRQGPGISRTSISRSKESTFGLLVRAEELELE
jgi:hypothetical protein